MRGITSPSLCTHAHGCVNILSISTPKFPSGFNRELLNVFPLEAGRRLRFPLAVMSKYNYKKRSTTYENKTNNGKIAEV